MKHLMIDGFEGFRSRFDDIRLMHEILQEVPFKLGAEAIMPPFVLPYYDGVAPEDVGLSGMVLLRGGHCTIHTFSYAECYFADILAPGFEHEGALRELMSQALPCGSMDINSVERNQGLRSPTSVHPNDDFGPHYTLNLDGFKGPRTLDGIFSFLDSLPSRIGMTPIMRPMVLKDVMEDGSEVLSGLTMIAESHIALHVFPERAQAYFDLFSCQFFQQEPITNFIKGQLPADHISEHLSVRGRAFERRRTERAAQQFLNTRWSQPSTRSSS